MINKFKNTFKKHCRIRRLAGSINVFLATIIFIGGMEVAAASVMPAAISDKLSLELTHQLTQNSAQTIRQESVTRLGNKELRPLQFAQSANRSKSEAMSEVKRRYKGAKILRIKLDSNASKYKVRILLPSGKVRNVTVSAQK